MGVPVPVGVGAFLIAWLPLTKKIAAGGHICGLGTLLTHMTVLLAVGPLVVYRYHGLSANYDHAI